MEEKKLEATESIALISRMIENTRNRIERHAGRPFLIWGYVTVLVSLFEYLCARAEMHPAWGWAWFAIPAVGWSLTMFASRHAEKQVTTYIDQVISSIWIVFGISTFFGIAIAALYEIPILLLIVLLMGMGTAITGLVIRFRTATIAGFAAMCSSLLFVWFKYNPAYSAEATLLFAAIFVGMMIIPGHILNYRAKHPTTSCSKS